MKKTKYSILSIITILIVTASQCLSQVVWSETIGTSANNDEVQSAVNTKDHGFAVLGYSPAAGNQDCWFFKLDSLGNEQWHKAYGGPLLYPSAMTTIKDDGFIIAAEKDTTYAGASQADCWILRIDSIGAIVWQKEFRYTTSSNINSIIQTKDGGFIMAGEAALTNLTSFDYWIVKIDSAGNIKWQKTYGGSGNDDAYSIIETYDGGYAIAGFTSSFGKGNYDAWVVKIDSIGNLKWQKTYGTTAEEEAYSLVQTKDSGLMVLGYTGSIGALHGDYWLLRLDSIGNIKWQKIYGGSLIENPTIISQNNNGDYLVSGQTQSFGNGDYDVWLLDIDTSGSIKWQKTYGGVKHEGGAAVQTYDQGYIMYGYTLSYGEGMDDMWIVKLDSNGNGLVCSTNTSITPINSTVTPTTSAATVINTNATSWKTHVSIYNTNASIVPACGITTPPKADFNIKDTIICFGDSTQFTNISYNATSWNWSFPDGSPSSSTQRNVKVAYSKSGTDTVKLFINDAGGNDSIIKIVQITINPLPNIVITGDSTICAGNKTTLTASGATSYSWSPTTAITPTTGSTVNAIPITTTTYTVIGTTAAGCSSKASIRIDVYPSNGFDLAGNLQVCIDTPSFNSASIQACIFNNRCLPTSGTLKLVLDTALHITSTTSDSVAHISGDTLIWNYDSLSDIGITHSVSLNGTISNLPAGDSVFVSMFITPTVGDSNPANNSITYWVKAFPYNCIGLPFDPNEKSVSPIGDIADTQKLTYTIHFQNTGTAVAHNVVVIDTLSAKLDPTTLNVLSSSSDVTTQVISGHIIKFIFNNINLPDTGTSKTTSIGVFTFTIKPMGTVAAGDKIVNNAGIYFDANPAIITNKTINTIAGTPLTVQNISSSYNIACFPNPFSTSTSIVFNTDGKHYLELDDITGRIIETMECTGRQYELQRNNLASGVYFIKAFDSGKGFMATSKLVVQ